MEGVQYESAGKPCAGKEREYRILWCKARLAQGASLNREVLMNTRKKGNHARPALENVRAGKKSQRIKGIVPYVEGKG